MEENDKANYFSIIPANVRYDKGLRDKAKLLYGEITALCNKEGYCWASNKYFADLYGVSKTTISTLIKELADRGYINLNIKRNQKNEIEYRQIFVTPISKNLNTYLKNFKYPISKNLKENNTSINNTYNNSIGKKFIEPTLDEIESYIKEKNLKVNAKNFYDYFSVSGWIDSKGNKVKNWKQKLLTWNSYGKVENKSNTIKRKYDESDFAKFYSNGEDL